MIFDTSHIISSFPLKANQLIHIKQIHPKNNDKKALITTKSNIIKAVAIDLHIDL